jgi:MFS transporter, MHS family, shikimate and dehydroshikimate transport protein
MVQVIEHRPRPLSPRGVAVASMIGTAIEWYDFFVYGTSVVLVLGPLFFPATDPLTSSLLAFSTFGVGFLVRPVGAAVLSHFGDRVGRRHALVFSLLLMGGATVGVGLLPTYAQVGVWAPVLLVLLRCAQGFAVGGEWGGAVLLAVEHAPAGRRAFYGSFPQYGTPIGLLGSSLAILLAQVMPEEAFLTWGWRLPFLGSIVLVAVGLWMRLRVHEAEEFSALLRAGATSRRPVTEVLRAHWRTVLVGTAATFVCHAAYLITSFLPSYATTVLGGSPDAALLALMTGSFVSIAVLAVVAWAAEARDRRRFVMLGAALSAAWVFPAFMLTSSAGALGLIIGVTVGLGVLMVQYAVLPALLADQFPVHVRYSGISLCFQTSAVLGGGLLPIVASWLVSGVEGKYWPAAVLMVLAGGVSVLGAAACRTTGSGPPARPRPGSEPLLSADRVEHVEPRCAASREHAREESGEGGNRDDRGESSGRDVQRDGRRAAQGGDHQGGEAKADHDPEGDRERRHQDRLSANHPP